MASAFREHGVDIVAVNEEEFCLTTASSWTIYLHNVFDRYAKALRKERQEILDNFVRGISERDELAPTFQTASSSIMPVLRSNAYHSLTRLVFGTSGQEFTETKTKSFPGGLAINLVYDRERSMTHLNSEAFDRWKIGFHQALAIGLDNLRDNTDPDGFSEELPGLFKAVWNDGYDTSRVLLPDIIHRLAVFGEPVAFMPARDHLWITGSRDDRALTTMLDLAAENHFGPYPLSEHLYILEGTRWTTFSPTCEPLAAILRDIRQRRSALDYQQQKEALEKRYARDGIDLFVASYFLAIAKDETSAFSWCVWSKGVDSSLPVTDLVMLRVNEDDKAIHVPWNLIREVASDLMELEPGLSPARYRVRVFPSGEQISVIRARLTQS